MKDYGPLRILLAAARACSFLPSPWMNMLYSTLWPQLNVRRGPFSRREGREYFSR